MFYQKQFPAYWKQQSQIGAIGDFFMNDWKKVKEIEENWKIFFI